MSDRTMKWIVRGLIALIFVGFPLIIAIYSGAFEGWFRNRWQINEVIPDGQFGTLVSWVKFKEKAENENFLYRYDAGGKEIWRTPLEGFCAGTSPITAILIDGDRVFAKCYVENDKDRIQVIDFETGNTLKSVKPEGAYQNIYQFGLAGQNLWMNMNSEDYQLIDPDQNPNGKPIRRAKGMVTGTSENYACLKGIWRPSKVINTLTGDSLFPLLTDFLPTPAGILTGEKDQLFLLEYASGDTIKTFHRSEKAPPIDSKTLSMLDEGIYFRFEGRQFILNPYGDDRIFRLNPEGTVDWMPLPTIAYPGYGPMIGMKKALPKSTSGFPAFLPIFTDSSSWKNDSIHKKPSHLSFLDLRELKLLHGPALPDSVSNQFKMFVMEGHIWGLGNMDGYKVLAKFSSTAPDIEKVVQLREFGYISYLDLGPESISDGKIWIFNYENWGVFNSHTWDWDYVYDTGSQPLDVTERFREVYRIDAGSLIGSPPTH